MAGIGELIRQHAILNEKIKAVECLAEIEDLNYVAKDIAKIINQLTIKLDFKLRTEDNFVYPDLLKLEDDKLRNAAAEFTAVRETVHNKYNAYSSKFNTRRKILKDMNEFRKETEAIFGILENMMDKETRVIYRLRHKNGSKHSIN